MTTPSVPVKGTKAIVAGIGATATAVVTAATALSVYVGDDAIDFNEVGGVLTTVFALVATVYSVWNTTNKPK